MAVGLAFAFVGIKFALIAGWNGWNGLAELGIAPEPDDILFRALTRVMGSGYAAFDQVYQERVAAQLGILERVPRDDQRLRALLRSLVGHIHPGTIREPGVGNHKIVSTALQERARSGYGRRSIYLVSGSDEHMLEEPPDFLIVLDQ